MPRKKPAAPAGTRRTYTEEFRREAVQMLLDGHSAPSVAERLGLSSPNLLYLWKKKSLDQAGSAAQTLGQRVHFLEGRLVLEMSVRLLGGNPLVAEEQDRPPSR